MHAIDTEFAASLAGSSLPLETRCLSTRQCTPPLYVREAWPHAAHARITRYARDVSVCFVFAIITTLSENFRNSSPGVPRRRRARDKPCRRCIPMKAPLPEGMKKFFPSLTCMPGRARNHAVPKILDPLPHQCPTTHCPKTRSLPPQSFQTAGASRSGRRGRPATCAYFPLSGVLHISFASFTARFLHGTS